ncbi:hypothetical protein ROHU_008639 [Labeo rohita]|uniref:CxC7-like cysteine cluster associated with KDZ transposases domain-containing protein n=1 Tax=Labeo rohita TaxID=84645 RepID=A0A498M8Y3_LABRO|nr:hypothetical protein ROHU_008639 [Labeo rohita]
MSKRDVVGKMDARIETTVNYVLDEDRPMNEIIIKDGGKCLFQTYQGNDSASVLLEVTDAIFVFISRGRRFAHFTKQGIEMARGNLDPIFRIPRKRKYEVTVEPEPNTCELPDEILHMIFILVVLQDGDPAIHTLALTCTRFWRIVREEYFLKEAHFCWLDSVVNWKAFSEEHRRTYRIPYRISCCIQCKSLYKDCEGYRGCGQRGKRILL